jgi:hypothetical protein
MMARHRTTEELLGRARGVQRQPRNAGARQLIVPRPAIERREDADLIERSALGLVGYRGARASSNMRRIVSPSAGRCSCVSGSHTLRCLRM